MCVCRDRPLLSSRKHNCLHTSTVLYNGAAETITDLCFVLRFQDFFCHNTDQQTDYVWLPQVKDLPE